MPWMTTWKGAQGSGLGVEPHVRLIDGTSAGESPFAGLRIGTFSGE